MSYAHRPVWLFTVIGSALIFLSRVIAISGFFPSQETGGSWGVWNVSLAILLAGLGCYVLAAYNKYHNGVAERRARYLSGVPGGAGAEPGSGFDPDEVMARYLAQRAQATPPVPALPVPTAPAPAAVPARVAASPGAAPPPRPSFGRKRH